MKKFILATIIILTSFFVIPKVEAQTISSTTYGYNTYLPWYIGNEDYSASVRNVFANGSTNFPLILNNFNPSNFNNKSLYAFRVLNMAFNIKLPNSGASNVLGYKAVVSFEISTSGIASISSSSDLSKNIGGYFYSSGSLIDSAKNNLRVVSRSNNLLKVEITTIASYKNPVNLSSGDIYIYSNTNAGLYGCFDCSSSSSFKATLQNIDLNIEYFYDESSIILGSIESGINETNNKLDDLNQTQQETNNQLNDLNENINNDNTDEATNEASEFFSTFQTDTFGLTSIITAPLTLIQSITSTTCSPLGLPLPYVDETLNLPCLNSIYEEHFGVFLDIYQTITFGIVAYWVCVRIFNLVKDFKNPEHDEIEVLDL